MSFLDNLGHTALSFGKAVVAAPGAVYDVAAYAVPGNQWGKADDHGFGGLLDNIGGRALDTIDPFGLGYKHPVGQAFNKSMEGLNWAYHKGIDQPLSTAMIMASHMDSGSGSPNHYGDLFNGDAWAHAYDIADKQSLGQSIVYGVTNDHDPFNDTGGAKNPGATPFQNVTAKDHPFLANAAALGIDLTTSWYLDPTVLAGKGAGAANRIANGAIKDADRATFGSQLDASAEVAAHAFKPNPAGARFTKFWEYASTRGADGAPLNGAEIRHVFPAFQSTAAGRGISNLLADALKDGNQDAARHIFAVAAGDVSAIDKLDADVQGGQALADALRHIADQKTVDLTDRALNEAIADSPEFRLKFNQQIDNLDHGDDVQKFAKDWHAQVSQKLSGDRTLLGTAGQLDYMPAPRSVTTDGRLRQIQGNERILGTVDKAHAAVVDPLKAVRDEGGIAGMKSRFGDRDSYSTLFQRGLYSLPVTIAYPARMIAATSPTNTIPSFVKGLRQVRFNGFVNTHEWDGALDQFDSMMRIGHVDDATRVKVLDRAQRADSESAKQAAINAVENAAIDGLRQHILNTHGLDIDRKMLGQLMIDGQTRRTTGMAATAGSAQYAATEAPAAVAQKTKGILAAKMGDDLDAKAEDQLSRLRTRVDQIVDTDGSLLSMPLVTPHLANRVPLFDIERANKLASDKAWATHFHKRGLEYADAANDLDQTQNLLQRAISQRVNGFKSSAELRLERAVQQKRMILDSVLDAANTASRWWKMSVLFRLGYPMRVLADDHLRIAARLGYSHFLGANLPEAFRNSIYNYLPGGALRNGSSRFNDAKRAYMEDQGRRAQLRLQLGRKTAHTEAESQELKALLKNPAAPEAQARLADLDPDGRIREFYDNKRDAKSAKSAINKHNKDIARWTAEDAAGNAEKVAAARASLRERVGQLDHATQQLQGKEDPQKLSQELSRVEERLRSGIKGYRPEKKHVGLEPVPLDKEKGVYAAPAFDSANSAYYGITASADTFDAAVNDGSQSLYNRLASGHFRTVSPEEPGYYHLWASILNNQMQHSPEYMSIIKGGVKTPKQFATWLRRPENANIRTRMAHFAHDPEDWGARLLAVVDDYLPTQKLQDMVAAGRVDHRQLEKMFPRPDRHGINAYGDSPPHIHGQLADMQSGRIMAARVVSDSISNTFRYLSEAPTDTLSRHPFFNAVYKREVKEAYARHIAARPGKMFGPDDLKTIEDAARKQSLKELQRTLWDVSAHSHTAHILRFVSPFFAAHQEALSRWWGIAKDDPSVVRKFSLAFDAPRRAGLVVNDKGEPVKPGESISVHNKILLQIPYAGENNAVNKFIKKLGGGKVWQVNENGLNIILQNGVANPGVGPVVTIPMETLVQKYPEATRFTQAARVLNQYPPTAIGAKNIAIAQLEPAWAKRLVAYHQGQGNAEFFDAYMRNYQDGLSAWNLAHGDRAPNQQEELAIEDRASNLAHRDLLLMAGSNLFGFTPAKPNSRFAVVQNGLLRLREQQRQEGRDFDWLRNAFQSQYGPEYLSMLATAGTNPANLDDTPGEVLAMKNHRSLLDRTDPKLARMIIGPEAARDAGANGDLGVYSPEARGYLQNQSTSPTSGQTYLGTKSLHDASMAAVAQQGWRQYDELVNYLSVQADQMGLSGYESSKQLMAAKKAGLDAIKAANPIFASDYDTGFNGSDYEDKINDMRLIASDPKLRSDAHRSDIYWLGQYLGMRDQMTAALAARAAQGLPSTMQAKANADLAGAFRAGVDYINQQAGSYWLTYSYHGIIENDPYLVSDGPYDSQNGVN